MKLRHWWLVRLSNWRWRRQRRRHKRELVRRYRSVPNAKQIIRHLDLPRGMQVDVLHQVKEAMWESEGRNVQSKTTKKGT